MRALRGIRVSSRASARLVAALVLVLLTDTLHAAEDRSAPGHRLLERMVSAMHELDYTGVLVYRQGPDELESLRIVHRGGEDGGRERLYSLDGVAREIIRDGDRVTCILPDSNSVMVDHRQIRNPLSGVLPGSPERISRHYQLEIVDAERIAGRDPLRAPRGLGTRASAARRQAGPAATGHPGTEQP